MCHIRGHHSKHWSQNPCKEPKKPQIEHVHLKQTNRNYHPLTPKHFLRRSFEGTRIPSQYICFFSFLGFLQGALASTKVSGDAGSPILAKRLPGDTEIVVPTGWPLRGRLPNPMFHKHGRKERICSLFKAWLWKSTLREPGIPITTTLPDIGVASRCLFEATLLFGGF